MPVRLRITLLFSLLVFFIFSVVCLGIYFFFLEARKETVIARLRNRAITTGTLLSRKEIFDLNLIRHIDSFTTLSMKEKTVQAFDQEGNRLYHYMDIPTDVFEVTPEILDMARAEGTYYFKRNGKEAVAYHYTDENASLVIISAGEDTDGHASLSELRRILIISFLTGNIIVLATGFFFSERLIRPLEKITTDVAEISAHNLVRRLQTGSSKDEWHNLAATLNELLNRLQESFEMQRRFIANASHELSTPLTSVSSQLEIALQRTRNAAEYRKVIESTYQDVRHMSKLTHTLLEFAKASGDAGGLELSKIRIDEVILDLPAQIAKINPAYAVTILFEDLPENEEKLVVYGNQPLLETAIKNILVNACKYSDDHTAVVRLTSTGDTVIISIQHQGPGIPQEEIPHIFQPFYRGEGNIAENTGGFGLGLSLASRIIKIHKGNIAASSHPGKGSNFVVQLPVSTGGGGH